MSHLTGESIRVLSAGRGNSQLGSLQEGVRQGLRAKGWAGGQETSRDHAVPRGEAQWGALAGVGEEALLLASGMRTIWKGLPYRASVRGSQWPPTRAARCAPGVQTHGHAESTHSAQRGEQRQGGGSLPPCNIFGSSFVANHISCLVIMILPKLTITETLLSGAQLPFSLGHHLIKPSL